MNYRVFLTAILFLLLAFLPGCEVVETIFEAGFWAGVLAVLAVLAIIIFLVVKLIKKLK